MPGRVINFGRLRIGDRVVQFRECFACATELDPVHEHPVLLRVVEIEPPERDWVRLRFDDGTGLFIDPRARALVELTERHFDEVLAETRELGESKGVIASEAVADDDTPIDTIRAMAQRIDAGLDLDELEPATILSVEERDGYTYAQLFWYVGLTALPSDTPEEAAALDDVTAKVLSAFEESYRAGYRASAVAYVRERIDEVGEPEDDNELTDEPQPSAPPIYWYMLSSDMADTMTLLECGHGALGDAAIVERLNGYRFQGSEGLVYATPDGLEVTWGEHGPTSGLPPREFEFVRDDIGLITRVRRSAPAASPGPSHESPGHR